MGVGLKSTWAKLGLGSQLAATQDQRAVITTELYDGADDLLVWVGQDAAGTYTRHILSPVADASSFFTEVSANGVTTATNASTSVYVEAQHVDFTLPTGVWTVRVVVSMGATHSANPGTVWCVPQLDGVAIGSGGKGFTVASVTPGRIASSGTATGIAAGLHTAAVYYRPNVAGTAGAINPQVIVDAIRTA